MRKICLGFIFLMSFYYPVFSQCTPATVRGTTTVNTPSYALNAAFNSNNTGVATINNLSSGMFNFTAAVAGTARWSNGVQIQNDGTVGDYIYVQPTSTNNAASANVATYTIQFNEPVTNFSLRCAGLNYEDQLTIQAFNNAAPITITAANFSDNVADPGHSGVIVISGGNTITGKNTAGGTSVNTNRITLTIPGPVTRIVMTSGKGDNSNSTVTLGFTSISYTRCVKAPVDVNATFVGTLATGNVGTNDVKPTGTTYGTAIAQPGNPGPALPTINADGTYSFTSSVAGVFKFLVPMCPGSVVVPDCAAVELVITVSEPYTNTNKPFANTDMATTPLNTPVAINTLANDKAGNNTAVTLNPASVVITVAPLHGTATVNPSTGVVTYTPNNGYTGYDILTYEVFDFSSPTPLSATANQIITVIPAATVNSTVAADDYNSGILNNPITGNVRDNDSDPEGNQQTITLQNTTISGKGTLALANNGSYTFTPVPGFSGPVNFPYQVCDNGSPAACTNATLYLLVFPSVSLPLDLVSFTTITDNANAKLQWVTANQDNVSHFEIERSAFSPLAFSVIGTVPANAETSGTYTFTDVNAKNSLDKAYYRLKMIDKDGRYSYSRINLVNFGKNVATTIHPSVVSAGQAVVLHTGATDNQSSYDGLLYNSAGLVIQRWKAATGGYHLIETSHLAKGIYIVQVQQKTGTTTQKFIVQ